MRFYRLIFAAAIAMAVLQAITLPTRAADAPTLQGNDHVLGNKNAPITIFEYASPSTVAEAVSLLASRNGNAKVISGGQSLMPMLAFRLAAPELLVAKRSRCVSLLHSAVTDAVRAAGDSGWMADHGCHP